ncbi:MAG: GTPase domain-containing protein [Nitrospirae bacterium]|nr:GTPase domain-containing protein [Nitrospirota bacterium]
MVLFNYSAKEITIKVVFYGPGMSGKTTNLQQLHTILPSATRGKLISLATEGDRTLFFDFLPVAMGKIKDFNIRFQLYTVPGQVKYGATRRLVLKGADAIVFVADSQRALKEQNIESYNDMRENLVANNIDPDDIPVVLQYNKRDIDNIMSIDEMNQDLNKRNEPIFEAVAVQGKGIQATFDTVKDIVVKYIAKKHQVGVEAPEEVIVMPARPEKAAPEKTRPIEPHKLDDSQHPKVIVMPGPETPQPRRSAAVEERVIQVTAAPPDLTKFVQAIEELRNVMSGINITLQDMLKKQGKMVGEITEMKEIFADASKRKGLGRFFR